MDRLVIESALSDANELLLSHTGDASSMEATRPDPAIILSFKAANTDQVVHAFSELKKIAAKYTIEFNICKTMATGIYDLEIKTQGLDEPLRIMNKAISNEVLEALAEQINKKQEIVLGTNVSEYDNWIIVKAAHIKDCDISH